MLTNTTIAIICGILIFAAYATAIIWTVHYLKKEEVES